MEKKISKAYMARNKKLMKNRQKKVETNMGHYSG